MATTSFSKSFIVKDKQSIDFIQHDLSYPRHVKIVKRNYKAENKQGIALLKQRLSNLENC
ncbi:hypothetical protein JEO90_10750 [Proteus vulgaris]|uniref:hypothetical protein n=1 Tax=Proteus TaxID=583 RepID=UPI0018E4BAC9|nr:MULTISPECIES: hypothetical protein [Proteus]MBI6339777.1 hypothetical protein [Proteus sp. PR00224]MBI6405614.1 hypothetical protein [Proteus sp. PR00208]MBI6543902.1 hypothetical protein [Proteus vulgaris]